MKTKILFSILCTVFFAASGYSQTPDLASMMANKIDASTVPDSYTFSWKYGMEIQSNGKTMNADYLIENNAQYFGMHMAQMGNDMTMIMDNKTKITVATIGQGKQKMAMASKIPDVSAEADKQKQDKKFTFKSLPDKTILGYKCKGMEASDAENTIVFYFTNDAPVNFADLFKSPLTSKLPDAFKSYFKPGDKPLIMSVDLTDKAGKKTSIKCISLEKEPFVFQKADYKFM